MYFSYPPCSGQSFLPITPWYGVVIAFKDYKIRAGILGSPWADPILKYFQQFFSTSIALNAIKNTIVISLESLVIAFPIPIIFALLLNQIQGNRIKRQFRPSAMRPTLCQTL